MSHDTNEPTSPEFEQIKPAKIAISSHSPELSQSAATNELSLGKRKWIVACIVLAAALVILVFLFLPKMVIKPDVHLDTPIVKKPPAEQVSPWQEAQMAKARKDAQEVLAQLLDAQFVLEEAKVKLWGAQDFNDAAELAKSGDEFYRQQDFTQAMAGYQKALAKLTELLNRLPRVTTDKLALGFDAIKAGDAENATRAFELVLEIEPDNPQAIKGLHRAGTLDQVVRLSEQAAAEEANGQLDQSLNSLEQALALDPEWPKIKRQLATLKQKILERDFNGFMSKGLSALELAEFSHAQSAFQKALRLKPNSKEAQAGLEEVAHRITQNKITAYREQAQQLIDQEQWQSAMEKYEEALKLDSSLLFAQKGRQQTSNRARLDQLLQEQIERPERLSTEAVYQEAAALIKVAATVVQPGPRLQQQVSQLQLLMQRAKMPVGVEITSDNQTEVTLFKRGVLGNFLRHELSLLPGRYILVGKRRGFRDVRREFVVSANKPPPSINIQCTEKI